jgi:hypothetical protein
MYQIGNNPLEIAAKMLDTDVNSLEIDHPILVNKLKRIQEFIEMIKPYGILGSTQVIANVIIQYFLDNELDSRLTVLEEKVSSIWFEDGDIRALGAN